MSRWLLVALLVGLWLLRVPSLAQPMASDQSLYAYAGERLMAGDAPYAGAWDQKPPGVHVVYALLWAVWPHESAVPGADMVVAGLVAALLVLLGRRRFTNGIGVGAAALFLFFGNPSLPQRMSGVFVRAQCETFIALAITAALVLAASRARTRRHLVGIGVLLGCAFWLKYNAAAYGLVVLTALAMWPHDAEPSWKGFGRDAGWVAGAGALSVAVPLAALTWAGAITDLYQATWAYNLAYSGESFHQSAIAYLVSFPIARASNDALWLLGGVGAATALVTWMRAPRDEQGLCGLVAVSWVIAACLSILINGARDLPQYFVQAAPALAFAASTGLTPLLRGWRTRPVIPVLMVGLLVIAVSRPGRLGHIPKFADNLGADWSALTGRTDRHTYLGRFGGRPQDKWVAREVDALADDIRSTTTSTDTIYVFGFSPGVFVKSGRRSASRFHWSRPVVIEFAAGTPGYGSAALLADLIRERPAIVALQKKDWGGVDDAPGVSGDLNSDQFFHAHPGLQGWLTAGYTLERETALFEVWRRRP